MKSLGLCLLNVALLAMLVACGKDNESGKNSYSNPYYSNQYGTISSPYSYGGYSINDVINQNPCITTGTGATQNRVQLQMTINLRTVLASNDLYVGVTSSGDVAVLTGQNSTQAVLTAYICQRGVTYSNGQPQLSGLTYGAAATCLLKPLIATLLVPGAYTPLYFRQLEGLSSVGQKFSMCQ